MVDSDDKERREAVRVDERCLFGWQKIAPEAYEKIADDYERGIPLYSQEKLADIQMITGARHALARIREKDADLADFLAHLDTKMNFLLRKMENRNSILDNLEMQDVNISAKGVAFASEESLHPDQIVEIHLLLLPDYVYIYALGRVISSLPMERDGEQLRRNSIEFKLINDEDRETIIRYNFNKQSRALRRQRLQRYGSEY